jgi:hypothetical protein
MVMLEGLLVLFDSKPLIKINKWQVNYYSIKIVEKPIHFGSSHKNQ